MKARSGFGPIPFTKALEPSGLLVSAGEAPSDCINKGHQISQSLQTGRLITFFFLWPLSGLVPQGGPLGWGSPWLGTAQDANLQWESQLGGYERTPLLSLPLARSLPFSP